MYDILSKTAPTALQNTLMRDRWHKNTQYKLWVCVCVCVILSWRISISSVLITFPFLAFSVDLSTFEHRTLTAAAAATLASYTKDKSNDSNRSWSSFQSFYIFYILHRIHSVVHQTEHDRHPNRGIVYVLNLLKTKSIQLKRMYGIYRLALSTFKCQNNIQSR